MIFNHCLSCGFSFLFFFFYFQHISNKMMNKCLAPKCKNGYMKIELQSKKNATFHLPIKKPHLNKQWIHFTNQINWNINNILCFVSFILKNVSSILPQDVISTGSYFFHYLFGGVTPIPFLYQFLQPKKERLTQRILQENEMKSLTKTLTVTNT